MMHRSLRCLPFLLSAVAAAASCETGSNCIEGVCVDGNCQCLPNYTGDDCSLPFVICEDGDRTCFNGSECVRNNEKDPVTHKYKYHCDCTKSFGVSSFAGMQCEYSVTAECTTDPSGVFYAFCTNGGTCAEIVSGNTAHQGCKCSDEFEGLHCQYLKGDAPPDELAAMAALEASRSSGGGKISGLAAFFIVFIVLFVAGMMGFMIYKKNKMLDTDHVPPGMETGGDLKLQEETKGDESKTVTEPEII